MNDFELRFIPVEKMSECHEVNRFHFQIKNISKTVQSGTICFQSPLYAEPFHYVEMEVKELAPDETKTILLDYQFSYGGRYVFYYWMKGAQLNTLTKTNVFVPGAGFYSGDTHNHSIYSDGRSTLTENRESMIHKGHSFLYSTDHNTLEHYTEIKDFAQSPAAEQFLHMTGWEYTTKNGHALAYNTNEVYDPSVMTERGNLNQWQTFVDEMNKKDGFVFLAHPFEAPRYEFGEDLLLNIQNITGIEVWNGFNHHALTYENRKAFEIWDTMNKKGDAHYIGNAVSDAHTAEKQGNPFIKGYLSQLSTAEVHRLLKSGKFFGSNGPEIQFSIDEAGIGETLYLQETRQTAKFQFTVFDPAGKIESIILYKGILNHKAEHSRNKTIKVLEIFPTGEVERRYFQKEYYTDIEDGEFYRIEVITEFGIVAYDQEKLIQDKGFAYTNPIWVEKQ